MWQNLTTISNIGNELKMKVLSEEFDLPIPLPELTYITVTHITENNVNFLNLASKNEEGYNPMDYKLADTGSFVVSLCKSKDKIKDENENIILPQIPTIIGQIIAIPSNIYMRGLGERNSILSTHLIVDPQERNKRCAEPIILNTIKEAFTRNIKIGYHWITDKRTKFAIETYHWYRPLSLSKVTNKGYQVHSGISYQPPTGFNEVTHSISIAKDFKDLKSIPLIRLIPTQEQLDLLSQCITFLTFRVDNTVIGIVGYRKFDIIKTVSKISIDAVQLSYFDTTTGMENKVFTNLLHILKKLNYAALHGILMSNLFTLINKHHIHLSSQGYLDFFNISHPNLQITDIALLYV